MIARRTVLFGALLLVSSSGRAQVLRRLLLTGRLDQSGEPRFLTADGRSVLVRGDEPTEKIFRDSRLRGKMFEANGRLDGAQEFTVNPIESRPMVLIEGGKRFRVTYYCDVCSIRTYSPGPCMCCQAETRLDLIDPAAKD